MEWEHAKSRPPEGWLFFSYNGADASIPIS